MNGLIEAQPDVYYWPKYYGASGWLGIKMNRPDVDWGHVADWLARSWEVAAPRRLLEMGGR
jgi:phosphoribosylglycinamide formyltransferase-1